MAPVLYKCLASAPSRAVLATIDYLNLKIDTVEVNVLAGDNLKPEFLKKNHLHTLPVLEDEDFIVADSHVIMTYLVQSFKPDSELYPKDLKKRSIVDQRLYLESTLMTPKIISLFAALQKNGKFSAEEISALENVYEFLDKYLEKTKFLAGDNLTLADMSCVSSLATLDFLVPIKDKYINLKKWFEELKKESWFQNVHVPGVKLFADHLKSLKLI